MFKSGVLSFAILALYLQNSAAITEEQQIRLHNKFAEVGSECIKKHPLSADHLALFETKVFPDHDNAGCFSACVFNKVGIFDDKGGLSEITLLENARNVFEHEEDLKAIELFLTTCGPVNKIEVSDGELGCERAKLAFHCFFENNDKLGFHIGF